MSDIEAWMALDPKLRGQVMNRLFPRRPDGAMYTETPLCRALCLARIIISRAEIEHMASTRHPGGKRK